jgi:PqqD family protein of HPr-rel-A system
MFMVTPSSATRRHAVIHEAVACAELGEEVVLLHVDTGIYFGLDALGARIWQLLKDGADEAEISDRLLAEYDVDPAQLRADLAAFLDSLEAKGLVRTVTG